jgi:hypothetical protein
VENFLSFDTKVEFSMIPGKSRVHPNHRITDNRWNGIDVLKCAAIYGANGSGKSNFCKAIDFAKDLIVYGKKPQEEFDLKQFKLRDQNEKTSSFSFEFTLNDKSFAYGFVLDNKVIHEEWLYEITKNNNKRIYERTTDSSGKAKLELGSIKLSNKDKEFLLFLAQGTRSNQLFLTESNERNSEFFIDIYFWFKNNLIIVFPESKYGNLLTRIANESKFSKDLERLISYFDTGISGIQLNEINELQADRDIPLEILKDIKRELSKAKKSIILQGPKSNLYLFNDKEDSKIRIVKLVTLHNKSEDGKKVAFDLEEESDGTLRLFDLLPGLINAFSQDMVFIIDELDRSMHPLLSKKFIEVFLNAKNEHKSQIIFTTHESFLLDLDLIRRDEIWFVEKDKKNASHMYSLEEYSPRYDKEIQKGYLMGRYGAIPVMYDSNKFF